MAELAIGQPVGVESTSFKLEWSDQEHGTVGLPAAADAIGYDGVVKSQVPAFEVTPPPPESVSVSINSTMPRTIDQRARALQIALSLNDKGAALDSVYGLEKGQGKEFLVEFHRVCNCAEELLNKFDDAERELFDAYLRDGHAGPEVLIRLALNGPRPQELVQLVYSRIWRVSMGIPDVYSERISKMETRYAETYHESMSLNEKLNNKEEREFRGIAATDALKLYNVGKGAWFAQPEKMIDILVANVHNLQQLKLDYSHVKDGGSDPNTLRDDLYKAIGNESTLQRAKALLEEEQPDIQKYVELTLAQTATPHAAGGGLPTYSAMRALQLIGPGSSKVKWESIPENVKVALKNRLNPSVFRAQLDPGIREGFEAIQIFGRIPQDVLDLITYRSLTFGIFRNQNALSLARFLESLPDYRRQTLRRKVNVDKLEEPERICKKNPEYERLRVAISGETNVVSLLHGFSEGAANAAEVLSAIGKTDVDKLLTLSVDFDEAYGEGSFDETVSKFNKKDRRSFEFMLALPRDSSTKSYEKLFGAMSNIVGRSRGVGWHVWLMDHFSLTGLVLEDGLRALRHSVDSLVQIEAAGKEPTKEHFRRVEIARARLYETLVAYYKSQGKLAQEAENAAMIALMVVPVLGACSKAVRASKYAREALAAGTVLASGAANSAPEAIFQDSFEPEGLSRNFLEGALEEAATLWF